MANIKLQRGNLSNIQNTSLEDGTLSIAKDTKQIFLDDDTNRTIVGEANYIKSVTYPATVDSNGTLSVSTVTTTNDGLMSKEDKTTLDEHTSNNNIHLSQEERDWINTKVHNDGNVVLQDNTTKTKYMLTVEDGAIMMFEAPNELEATNPILIDASSNTSYQLIIDSGTLFLQEV